MFTTTCGVALPWVVEAKKGYLGKSMPIYIYICIHRRGYVYIYISDNNSNNMIIRIYDNKLIIYIYILFVCVR